MKKLIEIAALCCALGTFAGCSTTVEDPDVDQSMNADTKVTCTKDCDETETHCVGGCDEDSCEASCHTDHDSCLEECDAEADLDED